jgi:hypothetical protein
MYNVYPEKYGTDKSWELYLIVNLANTGEIFYNINE